jgi:hypothetical protein
MPDLYDDNNEIVAVDGIKNATAPLPDPKFVIPRELLMTRGPGIGGEAASPFDDSKSIALWNGLDFLGR